jgi:LmbE family N-acetylglucosaminyl deacetylase
MITTPFRYRTARPADLAFAGWLALHAPSGRSMPLAAQARADHAAPMLPRAERVLVVTARPGPESADLGALLYAFGRSGSRVSLLSMTRGEASGLNSTIEPLHSVRPWELRVAARLLGVSSVAVADYPDGKLSSCGVSALAARIRRAMTDQPTDLVLVTDPAESGLDDAVVAMAACAAAEEARVPALARTMSAVRGGWQVDLGADAAQARAVQRSAVAAHASQSAALADLTVRLRLLGRSEWLRWLVPPPEAGPLPRADLRQM